MKTRQIVSTPQAVQSLFETKSVIQKIIDFVETKITDPVWLRVNEFNRSLLVVVREKTTQEEREQIILQYMLAGWYHVQIDDNPNIDSVVSHQSRVWLFPDIQSYEAVKNELKSTNAIALRPKQDMEELLIKTSK